MSEDLFDVHGFTFVRSGECLQCGLCGCEKLGCPHFEWRGSKAHCRIYKDRADHCDVCGMTHQSCIDFPDNPWIWVVRDGQCGYTFERVDQGNMDDLPFLNGEPWFRGG